ncbi:DHH family phosphoesterase [Corynebacterium poyangense]|uniref:DHH family phosphoesterase n=1 Tax=Corynebacterium poyangense TaxID=2684405 RepID=UPI001CCBB0E0|nr:bifunctional oligoribonuclease/PAP phosphatase NrnA [Corynebacterium poyangense]
MEHQGFNREHHHHFDKARYVIDSAARVAVVGHLRPDADAIGSITAVVHALRYLGKRARGFIGQAQEIPRNLLTIPGATDIELTAELPPVDLIIVVDCGSLDRTGALADAIAQSSRTLVIDHHASNPGFGTLNIIQPEAESTTVILADLFKTLGVPLDRTLAHCLYAGVLTDTGSFRWGTPQMHLLAAQLMKTGLDTRRIAEELLDGNSVKDLRMMGSVLSGVTLEQIGELGVAYLIADRDTVYGHSSAAVESLADFVRVVDDADIGVVFKETSPGRWAVSLRSSHIDVSRIATQLGGGGHVPAAGYTTSGKTDTIVAELKNVLDDISLEK